MLETLHSRLGEDGLTRLVAAFYRHVREDDVIGPMYPPDDWEGGEKRLRDFLIGRIRSAIRFCRSDNANSAARESWR